MKRHILLFIFIFAAMFQTSAQKDPCSESSPRPIEGTQNPCTDAYEIYQILKDPTNTSVTWEVPTARENEPPAGWHLDGDPYEFTEAGPNGKSYYAARMKVGKKGGVIKATINDSNCGTKVATLAVRPGIMNVTITEECVNNEKTFTATATPDKQANSINGYLYTWSYPEDWTHSSGENPYVTTENTITLTPGTEPGFVSADVVAFYKDNNGQGVGNANCDFGYGFILSEPCEGGPGEEPICIITTEDGLFTFRYMGATTSGDNTTVYFSIENNAAGALDMVLIEAQGSPQPLTAITPDGFMVLDVDQEGGLVSYTRIDGETTGGETELFGITMPTEDYELTDFYNITIFTTEGEFGTTGLNTTTCGDQPTQALPVELSSFTGKATASGIELVWTTASEINNDRFEIQRSTDGTEFTNIASVKGAGNSASNLSYSHKDSSPARGTNYYRIKQVDFDGTTSFSKVIAIESSGVAKTAAMSLYPNPATGGNVSIALDRAELSNKTFAVIITDMNGRKVFEQMLSSANGQMNIQLDQSKFSKGLYFVKVQGDNLVETQKLIVR